jgi:hypothetical protein
VTSPRPVVAAFDVDRTVTTRDCVVPFMRHVDGTFPFAARMTLASARILPALLADADHAVWVRGPMPRVPEAVT